MRQKCTLSLSSGDIFEGTLLGAPVSSTGELIFTTGMVGYSEAITDPSYYGQILFFSYPLIGKYGVPAQPKPGSETALPLGLESDRIHASAVIVGLGSPDSHHWNGPDTLDAWLLKCGVPGITGIDTRHLVHIVRSGKQVLGRVTPEKPSGRRLDDGKGYFDPGALNVMPAVSRAKTVKFGMGKTRVALVDCGVKWNIVRQIASHGCEVQVVPWDTKLDSIDCDAWVLSNGPGDPVNTGDLRDRVAGLLKGTRPVLGICLGHQILALAAGARTERMPYGHRSHNQPVNEVGTRRCYLTSQNHGYHVVKDSLPAGWEPWFFNANDGSIEGIRHKTKPFSSVQFHPEASAGPRDTAWITEKFIEDVRKRCR